ncbi:MAG: prepilin peptidase [Eubacteriales bacterium]|nr:prepilin peptidase [Eubacteriales bacterium]
MAMLSDETSVFPILIIFFLTLIASVFTARYAAERFDSPKKRTILGFTIFAMVTAGIMLCFFGAAPAAVKGIIFFLILAFSAFADIKTRECDDHLHLMILIAAFIGTDLRALPNMLLSGLFIGGIMLLTTALTGSKLGGADIKNAACAAFLLGLERGILGVMVGMLLAVIINLVKHNRSRGFGLIPYLTAGYMAVYFIPV